MNRPVKILAIDGGGIRGIIPATLLAYIESITGRPVAGLFDLIAGTSTGGILALGLTIPKTSGARLYSAQNFIEMYEQEGPRIFSRSLWRRIIACNNLTEEEVLRGGDRSGPGRLFWRLAPRGRHYRCSCHQLRD
jgi:patatin-like phospholipase/acyl hydrolase